MKNQSICMIVIIFFLISICVSQNEKDKEEPEYLYFKLKYEKGMKFTKTITTSVKKEYTNDEGDDVCESAKEVNKTKISVEEVKEDLPTKVKYEFVEIKKYKGDKEDKDYKDELKGHWIEAEVDKTLNVEIENKSHNFPDNDISKCFLFYLQRKGVIHFDFLKNVHKKLNDSWMENLIYISINDINSYVVGTTVKMTLSKIETVNSEKFAYFSLNYFDDVSSDELTTTYKGSIKVNVSKNRISFWEINIIKNFDSEKTVYKTLCEFNYDVKEPEKTEEKKEEVKPKNADE